LDGFGVSPERNRPDVELNGASRIASRRGGVDSMTSAQTGCLQRTGCSGSVAQACTYKQIRLQCAHLIPRGFAVKVSEFKRWLTTQGVRFEEGKRHTKLYYRNRQSTLPRHGGQELGDGLRKAILKQLGLNGSAR
jgi:mRNA interferase HicA